MSNFAIGNLFLLTSILAGSIGQVLIKKILSGLPTQTTFADSLRIIMSAQFIWLAGLAGFLIVSGFIFWVFCLHKLPLSYAYPFACSSALVVSLLSALFLGEPVTWKLLAGTLLIVSGSAFVVLKN